MQLRFLILLLLFTCDMRNASWSQQPADSTPALKNVIVNDLKNRNAYTSITPVQQIDKITLQTINSFSVGDAARYFSGVLIKDYGGIGGLKTISVRSLGAAHTGVLYDGLTMSDMQSGQVDLSRISSTFIQRISLYNGGSLIGLMPARSFNYAALLSANTVAYFPSLLTRQWQFGLRQGSFDLWQPFAGVTMPLGKKVYINATAEAIKAKGDYPFYIHNGNLSDKAKRNNSDIKSLNAEVNITALLKDSTEWKTKAALYISERGLPGAIVFFNERSVQRLYNTTAYLQSTCNASVNHSTAFAFATKLTHDYTRYLDPDYLNNEGRLDDHYNQNEIYLSAALKHTINKSFLFSYATDAAYTRLSSNRQQFTTPSRLSFWNVAALHYNRQLFHFNTNILYTHISEHAKTGNAAADKNKFTPAAASSFKTSPSSPFMMRVFYKRIFRLPTFNDLYYNLVGNINLKPEYSNQYNAGITYTKYISKKLNNLSISADGYYNSVSNKIIAIPNKNLFIWSMLNLGKVYITGIDVNAEATGKFSNKWKWFVKAAYTFQHAIDVTDRASPAYKDQIPYTPQHSGSSVFQLTHNTWNFGYSNIFSGSRYTLGNNIKANYVSGWITHDVSLSKSLCLHSASVLVKAELSNITNERYDIIKYFPMQGRNYKISLSISKK